MKIRVAMIVIALTGCANYHSEGTVSSAIVNGVLEKGWPAAGALVIDIDGYGYMGTYCSGTLIAPNWVLTAAHCVTPQQGVPLIAPIVKFYVGTDARGTQWTGPITGTLYQAEEFVPHPLYNPEDMSIGHDIGLVKLAKPVEDVTPAAINTTALRGSQLGAQVLYVGFGASNGKKQTGSGVKRSTTMPLTWIEDASYYTEPEGSGTCQGDSGGPGLLQIEGEWKVIGVVSAGTVDPTSTGDPCLEGYGIYSRVDAYASWISQVTGIKLPPCKPGTCLCDDACQPDGGCDNSICRTQTCSAALKCQQICPDAGCQLDCYLLAKASDAAKLQRLTTCMENKCEGADPLTCIDGPCKTRFEECMEGSSSQEGCDVYDACRRSCQSDAICLRICEVEAKEGVKATWGSLSQCLEESCGISTAELPNQCARKNCGQELDACFTNAPCDPLGETCGAGMACGLKPDGTAVCMESNGNKEGETCEDGEKLSCTDGLYCVSGVCRRFCVQDEQCGSEQHCVVGLFQSDSKLGACLTTDGEVSALENDGELIGEDVIKNGDASAGCTASATPSLFGLLLLLACMRSSRFIMG